MNWYVDTSSADVAVTVIRNFRSVDASAERGGGEPTVTAVPKERLSNTSSPPSTVSYAPFANHSVMSEPEAEQSDKQKYEFVFLQLY